MKSLSALDPVRGPAAAILLLGWLLTAFAHADDADDLPVFATEAADGLDVMLAQAGPKQLYLLGDATHGTREYYLFRQQVTRRLIERHGVRHLVMEFEPDEAGPLDQWINGGGDQALDAEDILMQSISRWPRWLWANREVAGFLHWLRGHNLTSGDGAPVRLHGMDLKDLGNDVSATYRRLVDEDPYAAWNFRADHMAEHVRALAGSGRVAVWAHNNHVGDKRADDVRGTGLVSMGQLLRERAGDSAVFVLGSAGGTGHYIAAAGWGEPWESATLHKPLAGSLAHLLAATDWDNPLLFWDVPDHRDRWDFPIYHRGIGVTYPRGPDDLNVYVRTSISMRYDAVVFFRRTMPVTPLRQED